MNDYKCNRTGRICFSYDQWLRTAVIHLPECLGCRSNRENPENEKIDRTENEAVEVLNIVQTAEYPAD